MVGGLCLTISLVVLEPLPDGWNLAEESKSQGRWTLSYYSTEDIPLEFGGWLETADPLSSLQTGGRAVSD